MADCFRTTYFADLAKRYDDAHQALLGIDPDDADVWDPLDRAFDAIRDEAFAYRPANMDEVADKAAFMASRWDDSDGLNPNRIGQLFASLGAVPTGRGSYVRPGEMPLEKILRRYDAAHPDHTVMPRADVIAAYQVAHGA